MFFRKRNTLLKNENDRLLMLTEEYKLHLDRQKQLITRSIDPCDNVLQRKKITESLYSFLLREARQYHNKE